jgi:hypothetical protein
MTSTDDILAAIDRRKERATIEDLAHELDCLELDLWEPLCTLVRLGHIEAVRESDGKTYITRVPNES